MAVGAGSKGLGSLKSRIVLDVIKLRRALWEKLTYSDEIGKISSGIVNFIRLPY